MQEVTDSELSPTREFLVLDHHTNVCEERTTGIHTEETIVRANATPLCVSSARQVGWHLRNVVSGLCSAGFLQMCY